MTIRREIAACITSVIPPDYDIQPMFYLLNSRPIILKNCTVFIVNSDFLNFLLKITLRYWVSERLNT